MVKYKVSQWFDTQTNEEKFGIRRQETEYAKWEHYAKDGHPMLFPSRRQAKKLVDQLNHYGK